ncbi:MAG: thiamine phosphate synthase, partial [Candidatus Aminicenantes bacterium]|nr:thiamine phosphate synthase [Candidatus Aminicenantes bacterium]
PLIINDRLDIALACNADGVHLGQKDIPLPAARKVLGPEKIIGITAANKAQAEKAQSQGADYLGVGPVFHTDSKDKPSPELGIQNLFLIRKQIKIPILAIGGINSQNAAAVMSTGVHGIAVISAVLNSSDPKESTQKLIREIGKTKS